MLEILFLRIFQLLSALHGIFPAQNPWAKPLNLKMKYYHPFFLLSLTLVFLHLIVQGHVLMSSAPDTWNPKISLYQKMIYYFQFGTTTLEATFFRITGIFSCNEVIKTCQIMCRIQDQLGSSIPRISIKHHKIKYFLFLGMALPYYTYYSIANTREVLWGRSSARFTHQLRRVLFGNNQLFCDIFLLFSNITTTGTFVLVLTQIFVGGIWLTELQKWTFRLFLLRVKHFSEVEFASFSGYKSNDELVVNAGHYEKRKAVFDTSQKQSLEESLELIQELKAAYGSYAKVAGWYLLEIITGAVMYTTIGVNNFLEDQNQLHRVFTLSAIAVLSLILVVTLGEFMGNKIETSQEEIFKEVTTLLLEEKCEKCWEKCSLGYTNWKWELTARNILNVNNKLITGVFGAIFTLTIFLFQIRTGVEPCDTTKLS